VRKARTIVAGTLEIGDGLEQRHHRQDRSPGLRTQAVLGSPAGVVQAHEARFAREDVDA
jgi:hypothetical protein